MWRHYEQSKSTPSSKHVLNESTTICHQALLGHPRLRLSTRAPVAGLLVGGGIDNAEHVSPNKRQEIFQRAERLADVADVAVVWATEGGVKCHVLAVVQHPDECFTVFGL